jgi:iron complex transport system ATP-binding protein
MILKVDKIRFAYGSSEVLHDVCFEVQQGNILGIVGPNGSGKTTLLKCLNRALKPQAGAVLVGDGDVSRMPRKQIAREMGVVPQDSSVSFPFTVLEIVLMGRAPHLRFLSGESAEDLRIVRQAMARAGVDHLADRRINEISGGQRQLVFIARALAQAPRLLLLDEPTLHLDINHQLEILELLTDLAHREQITTVWVSHDLNSAARYSDSLLLLHRSTVIAAGDPDTVLTRENIREAYGVDVEINLTESGFLHIMPVRKACAP